MGYATIGFVSVVLLGWVLILCLDIALLNLIRFNIPPSRNIPGPPRSWPTAQLLEKFLAGDAKGREWAKYGSVYRIHSLFRPEIVITRSIDVRRFYSDAKNHKKSKSSNAGWLFYQLLGDCLGLLNGSKWKELRRLYEPAFTHRAISLKSTNMMREAQETLRCLSPVSGETKLRPSAHLRPYPFWCTAISIYGPLSESERTELWNLSELRMGIFAQILKGGIYCFPLIQWWDHGLKKQLRNFKQRWETFNHSMFTSRQNSNPKAAIVAIWSETHGNPTKRKEVLQTIDESLFANLDVTSFVLSSCVLLLSQYKPAQALLRKEIRRNEKELEEYCNRRGTYLHYCILEALRLRPISAFSMPEESQENKVLGGYEIQSHTSVIIDARSVNREVDIWGADSDLFQPERFRTISKEKLKYSYFGFGFGSRHCLGKNLAETLIAIMIVQLLSKFDVSLAEEWNSDDSMGAWEVPSDASVSLSVIEE